ncbi:MAG: potassium channel family protein [Erythrobacter sp.]
MQILRLLFGGLIDVFGNDRVRGLVIFTSSLIALATILFKFIEGWAWIDAALFAVTTISTVGYGNIVPVTAAGKILAIVYILVGLGVFVAATSAVAEVLLSRREQLHEIIHRLEKRD